MRKDRSKKDMKNLDLTFLLVDRRKQMGGDDVIGRPLGGACVPSQRLLADLKEASEDASLPQVRVSSETKRTRKQHRFPSPSIYLIPSAGRKKNLICFSFFLKT